MKIISYNVNGIRAALKKGFAEWLQQENPDIICLQETKANKEQVETQVLSDLGYHLNWFSAQKKGYSGVATFSKQKPDNIIYGIGIEKYDFEGRMLRTDFGDLTLINSYFPSGTTGTIRQDFKMNYLDDVQKYIDKLKKERPNIVLCGDYNICHHPIDISKPENKKGVSGFLPEEREWVTKFLESGFIDSFRMFDESADKYSWWSYRAGSRAKNLGWRIDYNMVSEALRTNIIDAKILPDVVHSDHCPIVVELKL